MASHDDMSLVVRALAFAAEKHRDQRRKDRVASPYINHPIALTNILLNEGGVGEVDVRCAALLHDTVEDTETTPDELERHFGARIRAIVLEVSDDRSLPKAERKQRQIEHASSISREAKLVKLADKISNVRDLAHSPPADWTEERKREYFDWTKAVVDRLRGVHGGLEATFDVAYARRP